MTKERDTPSVSRVSDSSHIWIRTRMTVTGGYVSDGESLTASVNGAVVVLSHGGHPRDATQKVMLLEARTHTAPPPAVGRFLTKSLEGDATPAPAIVQDY